MDRWLPVRDSCLPVDFLRQKREPIDYRHGMLPSSITIFIPNPSGNAGCIVPTSWHLDDRRHVLDREVLRHCARRLLPAPPNTPGLSTHYNLPYDVLRHRSHLVIRDQRCSVARGLRGSYRGLASRTRMVGLERGRQRLENYAHGASYINIPEGLPTKVTELH